MILEDQRAARIIAHLNEATAYRSVPHPETHPLIQGLILTSMALLREIMSEAQPSQSGDPLIEEARHPIATHLTNPKLTVSWMALRLGCNADYLSHRFHQATGHTISTDLTAQRIAFARRRLQDSVEPIGIIARSAGFRDPAYFSRVFRDQVGQSPRAWRRSQAST